MKRTERIAEDRGLRKLVVPNFDIAIDKLSIAPEFKSCRKLSEVPLCLISGI